MRFFLIDKIVDWQVGEAAAALKNVALSEDFFDDHFPRRPIMPGVLMLEGMAQLSGLLLEASLKHQYDRNAKAVLTVVERTKFRQTIHPGDTLEYRTRLTGLNAQGGKVIVEAYCEDTLVVSSGMVFAFKDVDDPTLDQKRQELLAVWMRTDSAR